MPCPDSLPLVGPRARLEAWVPITASGGFGITEVARIFVPPSSTPLALEVDVMVGATTAAQVTDMTLVICPAATLNLLAAVNGRFWESARAVPDLGNFGEQMKYTTWPPDGTTWPPGDYVLGANRGANAGQVGGSVLAPGFFWWHR